MARRLAERLLTKGATWSFLAGLALGVALAMPSTGPEPKSPEQASQVAEVPTIGEIEASLK